MRWRGRRQSNNVDDRRFGSSAGLGGLGGMGRGGGGLLRLLPTVLRLLGPKGTLIVALGVGAFMLFGGDLSSLLGGGTPARAPSATSTPQRSTAESGCTSSDSQAFATAAPELAKPDNTPLSG